MKEKCSSLVTLATLQVLNSHMAGGSSTNSTATEHFHHHRKLPVANDKLK